MRLLPLLTAMLALITSAAHAQRRAVSPQLTISVLGTNDLHGHLEALPWLSAHVDVVRRLRAGDGGGVLLLDGGDMFQGTLESNLGEGAPVVRAYNALGYAAAAVGNHEFDFGPVGPAPAPTAPGDDARGALKARAGEARFPFLAANLQDAATRRPVSWANVRTSTLVTVAGVRVGIIGALTTSTARTTLPRNFRGLSVTPLLPAVLREARSLRAAGATVVAVVAHEGGRCATFQAPDDLAGCERSSEIFALARGLPHGTVDVIVAGHTHAGIAHRVAGVPIIESFSDGRAFGRVDLIVDRLSGRVTSARIHPPRFVCREAGPRVPHPSQPSARPCRPAAYEGERIVADARIGALLAPDFARARARREERVGVVLAAPFRRLQKEECALGNLFADLLRAARPRADVAITNGGGLRADLPAGPLTYGAFFEAFPFDNGFATVKLTAAELARLLTRHFARGGSIVSLSGLRADARCGAGGLEVHLRRDDGTPVPPAARLTVATSDFLATGGDGFFDGFQGEPEGTPPIREAMVAELRRRGGTLRPDDPGLFDPGRPRLKLPGRRPLRCPGP